MLKHSWDGKAVWQAAEDPLLRSKDRKKGQDKCSLLREMGNMTQLWDFIHIHFPF